MQPQLKALFMKIDSGSHGHIAWDAFCTYMQLELTEKEDSYTRAREVGKLLIILFIAVCTVNCCDISHKTINCRL